MTLEVTLYSLLLIVVNYIIPFFLCEKRWYVMFIIGGILFIAESLMFMMFLENGGRSSGLLMTFLVYTTFLPIPNILLITGIVLLIIKKKKQKRLEKKLYD